MRNTTYILIIALLLLVQHSNAQEKFVLEGILTGYEDSIKFKICPIASDGRADDNRATTMYLLNSKFSYSCDLKEPSKYVLMAYPKIPPDNPKDFEAISFWVENRHMILNGQKGNLSNLHISGSKIQDEYEELTRILAPIEKGIKEIKDSILTIRDLAQKKKDEMRPRFHNLQEEFEKKRIEFIFNHPNYYFASAEIAFEVDYSNKPSSDKNRIFQFYNQLPLDFKLNKNGLQIKSFLDKNQIVFDDLKVGDKPYLFSLPDSSGNLIELASLKGNFILIDFWASGCGPCRQEHKNYHDMYQKYHSKGFKILSVNQDISKKYWVKAMQMDNMIWKSVWDHDRYITKMYNVTYLPTNYLVNGDGIIIERDLRGDKLAKKLEELYKEK